MHVRSIIIRIVHYYFILGVYKVRSMFSRSMFIRTRRVTLRRCFTCQNSLRIMIAFTKPGDQFHLPSSMKFCKNTFYIFLKMNKCVFFCEHLMKKGCKVKWKWSASENENKWSMQWKDERRGEWNEKKTKNEHAIKKTKTVKKRTLPIRFFFQIFMFFFNHKLNINKISWTWTSYTV